MKTRSKAFLELILLHSKNPKRTKELLATDRRINQDERNIVRGFLMMRDNQNSKALAMASSLKVQQDQFVESMRQYLIGATLNNLGKYRKALEHFQECYQIMPKGLHPHLECVVLFNLHLIHMNLHQIPEAREILSILRMMPEMPEEDRPLYERLEFGFLIATEEYEAAKARFEKLCGIRKQLGEHEQVALLVQFYHYGIVFDQFDICEMALAGLCEHKKYALTQNYNYMKILLAHLREHAPIYINEGDFKDHPALFTELKFIRALDQNKQSDLPKIWRELQALNPQVFQDGYQFHGYKSVFSRCLMMHQSRLSVAEVKTVKESNLSILDAIEQKLSTGEWVTKEQLFYYLYGKELDDKAELNRISKYINKLKSSRNLEIVSQRGAYQLKKAS